MTEGDDGNYKLDTEAKVKSAGAKGKWELKLTPSKIKFEKSCTPEQINDANTTGSFLGRVEHKVGSDKPDVTAGFTYARPKATDDVGAWFEGNVTYNGLKNFTGDISALFAFQNQFFIGSQIKGDLQTRKADEITGVVAAKLDGSFVYMHANCLNHIIRLGFSTTKVEQVGKLSAETEIKMKEKGPIQDRATTRVAFDHAITDDMSMKYKFDITKQLNAHFTFIHRINNNLRVTMTDNCDPLGFFKNPGSKKYNFGISFEGNF